MFFVRKAAVIFFIVMLSVLVGLSGVSAATGTYSNSTSAAIGDGAGGCSGTFGSLATTTIDVADAGTITDVNVGVSISHTYVGDITVWLESPTGTQITLIDRPGYTGSGCGFASDHINATLDDESAGGPVENGNPPNGSYTPAQALSAFDGEELQGTWTLSVGDNSSVITGTLNSWSLTVEYGASAPAPTSSFTFSATDLDVDFTDTSSESPTSWAWDFDDGSTSTDQNPSHTFAAAGDYHVCLIASNAQGAGNEACTTVTVEEGATSGGGAEPKVAKPDNDSDDDGVPNYRDNCPNEKNADQEDGWGSALGDVCDTDWYNMIGIGIAGFTQKNGEYHLHGNCTFMEDGDPRCPEIAIFNPATFTPASMPMEVTTDMAGTWSVWIYYLHSNGGKDVYQVNIYSTNPPQPDTLVDDRLELHVSGGVWRWYQRGGDTDFGGLTDSAYNGGGSGSGGEKQE